MLDGNLRKCKTPGDTAVCLKSSLRVEGDGARQTQWQWRASTHPQQSRQWHMSQGFGEEAQVLPDTGCVGSTELEAQKNVVVS